MPSGFCACFLAAVATSDRGEGELPRHAANAQPAAEAADISRWLALEASRDLTISRNFHLAKSIRSLRIYI